MIYKRIFLIYLIKLFSHSLMELELWRNCYMKLGLVMCEWVMLWSLLTVQVQRSTRNKDLYGRVNFDQNFQFVQTFWNFVQFLLFRDILILTSAILISYQYLHLFISVLSYSYLLLSFNFTVFGLLPTPICNSLCFQRFLEVPYNLHNSFLVLLWFTSVIRDFYFFLLSYLFFF